MEKIATSRLILKKLDYETLHGYFQLNSPQQRMQYLELTQEDQRWFDANQYLKRIYSYNDNFVNFLLVEKASGRAIGMCGYHTVVRHHNRAELGYEIYREEHKNHGFMSEAIAEVIKYGFMNMNLHRIEALIGPSNTPSLALVKPLGFNSEGTLRKHYLRNGVYEDSIMHSLLREEYLKLGA